MSNKFIGWAIAFLIIGIFVYIVIQNWNTILGIFGKGGLQGCKGLSDIECVKKNGAKETTSTNAGDRYDYPNTQVGSYGFYSNGRVVLIGSSPDKKGAYDKKEIIWDDGSRTQMKEIFK